MEIVDQKNRIEKISETGYEFHFEQYLSEGWDIFRKAPMQFILYTLIVGGITVVQHLVTAETRATASALFLLINNLVGIGGGILCWYS